MPSGSHLTFDHIDISNWQRWNSVQCCALWDKTQRKRNSEISSMTSTSMVRDYLRLTWTEQSEYKSKRDLIFRWVSKKLNFTFFSHNLFLLFSHKDHVCWLWMKLEKIKWLGPRIYHLSVSYFELEIDLTQLVGQQNNLKLKKTSVGFKGTY